LNYHILAFNFHLLWRTFVDTQHFDIPLSNRVRRE
jgi:hypothetical protein